MTKNQLDICKAYVIAIKDLVSDSKSFFVFAQNLNQLSKAIKGDVLKFFNSPLVSIDLKKNLLQKVIPPNHQLLKHLLGVLIDHNHLNLLHFISHLLNREEQTLKGEISADVYSAIPLSLSVRESIKLHLKKIFKKSIRIREKISPALIGGIKIVANGIVFDDTLLFHLKQIKLKEV